MMKKRYLITYTDRKITSFEASDLLGISNELMNEGVSYLTAETVLKDNDALHFEKMGISSICLTSEDAVELSKKDGVFAVEEDYEMSVLGFPDEEGRVMETNTANLWNIDLVKAPEAWARGITGTGINLAILDTGIASHPDLVIAGGVSFIPGVSSYNDGHGHGTHCAGISAGQKGLNKVYGVAKDCNLYAVKVLSDSGSGYSASTISGMEWCVRNNINVASISLGSRCSPSIAYAKAIKNCEDHGVTVVCASGDGFRTPFPWVASPANSYIQSDSNGSPVAVGAVDRNSVIANFSSRGANSDSWNPVTVVAPGVSIYSTYLDNGYKIMSGTSMACSHVAGMAALILQKYGKISPHLVMAKISSTTNNLGSAPFPNEAYGYGLINCKKPTM